MTKTPKRRVLFAAGVIPPRRRPRPAVVLVATIDTAALKITRGAA